jgi:hypothetical protein
MDTTKSKTKKSKLQIIQLNCITRGILVITTLIQNKQESQFFKMRDNELIDLNRYEAILI